MKSRSFLTNDPLKCEVKKGQRDQKDKETHLIQCI